MYLCKYIILCKINFFWKNKNQYLVVTCWCKQHSVDMQLSHKNLSNAINWHTIFEKSATNLTCWNILVTLCQKFQKIWKPVIQGGASTPTFQWSWGNCCFHLIQIDLDIRRLHITSGSSCMRDTILNLKPFCLLF